MNKGPAMKCPSFDAASLRDEIVGIDAVVPTPFGERLMVYCDYTASGRSLRFIEAYLLRLQRRYANSHTEDDITGRSMTRILHGADAAELMREVFSRSTGPAFGRR